MEEKALPHDFFVAALFAAFPDFHPTVQMEIFSCILIPLKVYFGMIALIANDFGELSPAE